MGSGGTVLNGYSNENIAINGVMHVAIFKLVGFEWQNKEDVLVSLESVEDSLKDWKP